MVNPHVRSLGTLSLLPSQTPTRYGCRFCGGCTRFDIYWPQYYPFTIVQGATVHPIILNNVIHGPLGFANGVRVSAAVVSVGMLLFVLCSRTRLPPKKNVKAIPIGEFIRDAPYMAVLVG